MSKLITQALAAADDDARRLSLGTAMFLAFRTRRAFAPSAWEPLAQYATLVLEPRMVSTNLPANTPEMTAWNQIRTWLNNNSNKRDHPRDWLERNYVLAGLPELWKRHNWEKALQTFREDLALFGVEF
jgi:hypothetical protein